MLHPGTSGFGAFKRWPPERFGALARALLDDGLAVALTHGPGEAELAEAVSAETGGRAVPLPTPDLVVLAEVLRRARVFAGGDTGPLHLAGLVGTPQVALFGPKDPTVYGPFPAAEDRVRVLVRDDVACRPCRLRRCDDPLCMRRIDPVDVHEAVCQVLPSR